MKRQMIPEKGDVLTVVVSDAAGKATTFRNVTVNSVPHPERFTFWSGGRLIEAESARIQFWGTLGPSEVEA